MNSIKEDEVLHYVLVKEGFESPADMQMFYFAGNPILFGNLEDACDDLRYVNNLEGVPHKILRVKFEKI